MAILAGIDEAGFGPVLGPLIVSGVAFRVPDDRLDTCLWETLSESCARSPARGARRLVITDSKKLYRARSSMAPLERAALVMLAAAGLQPRSLHALLASIAPEAAVAMQQYPWYGRDLPLPVSKDIGDISTRANAVRLDCRHHDIEMLAAFSEPLLEGHYNRLVRNTRNKAVVLLGLVLRVVERILRSAPDEQVHVCVDRLGGRTHYREALSTALPGYALQILEESPDRSAYRLICPTRVCLFEFVTNGDDRHFPVALGSIYSKYLRELYMGMFNDYWCEQIAGLKPTAGYYSDAQRWLRDAAPAIRRLSIDRGLLVRER